MHLKLKSALLSAALFCAFPTFAADAQDVTQLIGYTPGVEVINLDIVRPQIDMISGIVYSQIKSTRAVKQLRMTLEIPRTTAKKPAIIYFPGGGFTSSDHEKFSEMRRALAEAGFVVAATEYRTVPTMFPALLHDAKAAVRFLRAHADEYGIDPNKIAVLGDSAGGYLAQMTAVTNGEKEWDKGDFLHVSSDVQAAVTIYGISNLLNISEGLSQKAQDGHKSPAVSESLLLNGVAFANRPAATIFDNPEKTLAASPITHIDGTEPPFLIFHGAKDPGVSPIQSAKLYKALKDKKVDAQYVLVANAKHGDLVWYQDAFIQRVVDWFVKTLKPAKGEPAAGATR